MFNLQSAPDFAIFLKEKHSLCHLLLRISMKHRFDLLFKEVYVYLLYFAEREVLTRVPWNVEGIYKVQTAYRSMNPSDMGISLQFSGHQSLKTLLTAQRTISGIK